MAFRRKAKRPSGGIGPGFDCHASRPVNAAWCRKRASPEEFDKLVDYACIFAALRTEAKKANSDATVDTKLMQAFLAKNLCWD